MSNEYIYKKDAASEIRNIIYTDESQKPASKRVKVKNLKMTEPTAAVKRKFKTVPKDEFTRLPTKSRGISRILVPYAEYPYEPQLFLVHAGGGKFEYRYRTLEDLNTNLHPKIKNSSLCPKPPRVWCLQCGEAFKKSNSANSHSKNKHLNYFPAYKMSYFLKNNP